MKYQGGPRDGEEVEEIHVNADEIKAQITRYTADHQIIDTVVVIYTPGPFGGMVYRGLAP